jgi:hypothetical protein
MITNHDRRQLKHFKGHDEWLCGEEWRGAWLGVAMRRGGGVRWRDARAVRCQRRQVPGSAGGGSVFVPGENRGWWGKEGPGRVGHYGQLAWAGPKQTMAFFI